MNDTSCEICTTRMERWLLPHGNILLRCPECGHIIRRLDLCPADATESVWSGDARLDRIRLGLTFRRIRRVIGRRQRLRVLELGVGGGQLLSRFLEHGHDVSGLDLDVSRVPEQLRRRATLWQTTAEQADLPSGRFDLVVAVHVIEHVRDPALVMRKCFETLRPGGIFYCVTPNGASASLRLFKDAWWMLEDPTHVRFFSPPSITTLLKTAGLRDVQTKTAWWDSVGVEANSIRRWHQLRGSAHGRLLSAVLTPFTVASRLVYRDLTPCMEVVTLKQPVASLIGHC